MYKLHQFMYRCTPNIVLIYNVYSLTLVTFNQLSRSFCPLQSYSLTDWAPVSNSMLIVYRNRQTKVNQQFAHEQLDFRDSLKRHHV